MKQYLVIDKRSMKAQSVITVSVKPEETQEVLFMEQPQDLNIQFLHHDYLLKDGQIIEMSKETT
ncbi:hypothetical protein [Acinetobacter nectaris]|uniref:hypothetical protein n=1 Tax=Acinetobacter nectaris TaxID=1219382 RepID=UPI001F2814C8|nr:hypothetical protein [Acinetobacter nectaris]MCF9035187.1 hypothetical protein [Acinetobacter nectaris]